ncbi:unnamed protein product [Discosporangium mesarthrocarpum]
MDPAEQDNVYPIQGFCVSFPKGKKPFPSQFAVMSKMLLGLRQGKNCLLESPTGTGKTLALLCSALAWQRQQRLNGREQEEKEKEVSTSLQEKLGNILEAPVDHRRCPGETRHKRGPIEIRYDSTSTKQDGDHCSEGAGAAVDSEHSGTKLDVGSSDDEGDVFEDPKKRRKRSKHGSGKKARKDRGRCKGKGKEQERDKGTGMGKGIGMGKAATAECDEKIKGISTDNGSEKTGAQESESLGVGVLPPVDLPSVDLGCCGRKTVDSHSSCCVRDQPEVGDAKLDEVETKKKKAAHHPNRVPRVYFCSRTHSQLGQAIAELRTCEAALTRVTAAEVGTDTMQPFRMTLLSSRARTCIHPSAAQDERGVDEACKQLVKKDACGYFRQARSLGRYLPQIWDVEDIVKLGRTHHVCPYYTARASLSNADLVFCPYNYLVDPSVRDIMGISLKNSVVIFDEAHNIESTAREAASANLSLMALINAAKELQKLVRQGGRLVSAYELILPLVDGVRDFLLEAEGNLTHSGYEQAHKLYTGEQALGIMKSRAGVTSESVGAMKEVLITIAKDQPNPEMDWEVEVRVQCLAVGNRDTEPDSLSKGALMVVSSLLTVLGFLTDGEMENVEHYRMVVLRERIWGGQEEIEGGGVRRRGRRGQGNIGNSMMQTKLCFWCMSAGVCFSKINSLQVHSLVLSSGTLSPLDSFAGELRIDFEVRLEAPHVIDVSKQCFVGSVGQAMGVSLDARYANQDSLVYQDALGGALVQYSRVVPGGILVFLPSYSFLNKLHGRWQSTGLLATLSEAKSVHVEPRSSKEIDKVLAAYHGDIDTARNTVWEAGASSSGCHRTGALMLAVARGKVSEGIDFKDEAARACVVVGIAFPNVKDLQVQLKRKYQDACSRKDPRLVGGDRWFKLQAFRALNQAVGRCIRHRSDYGAIILCDPRFASQRETTGNLSRWVRSSVKHYGSAEVSVPLLASFFSQHHGGFTQGVPFSITPLAVTTSTDKGNISSDDDDLFTLPLLPKLSGQEAVGRTPLARLDSQVPCSNADSYSGICSTGAEDLERLQCADPSVQMESVPSCKQGNETPGLSTSEEGSICTHTPLSLTARGSPLSTGKDGGLETELCPALLTEANVSPPRPSLCSFSDLVMHGKGLTGHAIKWSALHEVRGIPHSSSGILGSTSLLHGFHFLSEVVRSWGGGKGADDCGTGTGGDLVDETPGECVGVGVVDLPAGIDLGTDLIEMEGQWEPRDGLVYACVKCRVCPDAILGVRILAAGTGGGGLVGKLWFFEQGAHDDTAVKALPASGIITCPHSG